MPTVYASFGQAGALSLGRVPVYAGAVRSETITSSGTAASGLLTANTGDVVQVFCASAVYATVRGTASASNGVYVPAGQTAYIGCAAGDVLSVIDV